MLKVVTIGGGSSYTPELIEGFIKRYDRFPITDLILVDIEAGKEKVEIITYANSMEELLINIDKLNDSEDGFKVVYQEFDNDELPYKKRMEYIIAIAMKLKAVGVINNPKFYYSFCEFNGIWYFGKYYRSDLSTRKNFDKPHSYSQALNVDFARSIVNIAINKDYKQKIIDPCCGIGTVVIEALEQGIDIKGYELVFKIGMNAKLNVEYMGYDDVITCTSMYEMDESFDTAIVDLPYNIMSHISNDEQLDILNYVYSKVNRAIIINCKEDEDIIKKAGFKIEKAIKVRKNELTTFSRQVYLCVK